jgi:heat shock protein HtpX
MISTIAFILGISTLFFTVLLSIIGVDLLMMPILVISFNILQWFFAPKLLEVLYHVRPLSESEAPSVFAAVKTIAQNARMAIPKLMLADMSLPNAFAYGSPIGGRKIAVTSGLMKTLENEEVEAVLGHELGHLRHRDVQIMMIASILPAIFYYIGFSLFLSGMFGGRNRNSGGGMIIGLISMAIYWILSLVVLGLSRLREYYADQFAARHVTDGARKLSEALAKIVVASGRAKSKHQETVQVGAFRALFISDPERAVEDTQLLSSSRYINSDQKLVQEILTREVTTGDRVVELFSTHPNIVKRLKVLKKAAQALL